MSAPPETPICLVIRSVGRAGASQRAALADALGVPLEPLTAVLLRAPGVLGTLPDRETGERVLALVRAAGVVADLTPANVEVEPGRADLDVAVRCWEISKLPALVERLSAFLGQAQPLTVAQVLREPPLVLGRVSRATVDALEELLEGCGARVMAATPATSRFDARVRTPAGVNHIYEDLDAAAAEQLWVDSVRAGGHADVVNTAMHTWDLVLERGNPGPELMEALIAFGVPARVVERLTAQVPVVVAQGLDGEAAASGVARLRATGAEASARRVTFADYSIRVDTIGQPDNAAALLAGLGGLQLDAARALVSRAPTTVVGPFGDLRARWLVHELRTLGCKANRVQATST